MQSKENSNPSLFGALKSVGQGLFQNTVGRFFGGRGPHMEEDHRMERDDELSLDF